jgi:RNA polymerase sigma-70 factor (ECF subfamily)
MPRAGSLSIPVLQLVESNDGPEKALLARLSDGDREAFDQLVVRYLELLLGYAYYLTGMRDVSEDIAQEVFCWIWDNRLSLRVRTSLRSYLLAAVRNRALDYLRRDRREAAGRANYARHAEMIDLNNRSSKADDHVTASELASVLDRAIAELPERRREILRLRWQQLSHAEIAAALGISVKTVEAQITRAFESLRSSLGPLLRE